MRKKLLFPLLFIALGSIAILVLFAQGGLPQKNNPSVLDESFQKKEKGGFPVFEKGNTAGVRKEFKQTFIDKPLLEPFRAFVEQFLSGSKDENPIHPISTKKQTRSKEELNAFIWPSSYIQYMRTFEEIMRKDGFLQKSDAVSLASDEEIFSFLTKIIEYLAQKGEISNEQAFGFNKGVLESLPPLIEEERRFLERQLLEANKTGIELFHTAFLGLMERLKYALFLSSPAQAQIFGGGVCSFGLVPVGPPVPGIEPPDIVGDCYKDLDPFFLVCGFNAWAPCCNCFKLGVIPLIPIGCLNAVCAAWPNAIWDPETGICGCG